MIICIKKPRGTECRTPPPPRGHVIYVPPLNGMCCHLRTSFGQWQAVRWEKRDCKRSRGKFWIPEGWSPTSQLILEIWQSWSMIKSYILSGVKSIWQMSLTILVSCKVIFLLFVGGFPVYFSPSDSSRNELQRSFALWTEKKTATAKRQNDQGSTKVC